MINTTPHISDEGLKFRPADVVMNLNRLGTLYPYPLSFMRSLVRRILNEKWEIKRAQSSLCEQGYGHVVYEIKTKTALYSYVVFADYLDPNIRSDRVIAEKWDITMTLCEGRVGDDRLEEFRKNVPLQEKGRVDSTCLSLSRANKSARNFNYVVDRLASGRQPDFEAMAKVGYLYRTTAVYGSGKFGMADWQKVYGTYDDFARPFAAEMFSCFLIRDFSIFQANYVAKKRAPETAVVMDEDIQRYVGIGNATGLGMAPYLINHPLLINNWIEIREAALARVKQYGAVKVNTRGHFTCLAEKAIQHLEEIATDNHDQNVINNKAREDMGQILSWFDANASLQNWSQITDFAEANYGHEAQELLNAILLEVFPELFLDLEDELNVDEKYTLIPEMSVNKLRQTIEDKYGWALSIDFDDKVCRGTFWYRSEEKLEPRLGDRYREPGAEKEMLLGIACCVRECYDDLTEFDQKVLVAEFVMAHPEHRYMVRRIQTMALTRYGEIRANVLDKDVLPIHLLRCKLSFFGVGKFDPRSRLWVRNTMFQGAPLISDIGRTTEDTWCFPIKPQNVDNT
ncbi:MAG: hypothetical protein EX271_01280 [Acidimicrobiales bacterium]|nr:hypothetical protein [Hyphomonadaceae bacterium]RZV44639.1 MAG: hypothetical protein EX271_01280 [Acidimicrobiales bacterium]